MTKKELINAILDMSDEEVSDISNYIGTPKKAQGGVISLGDCIVNYEEVSMEDFFNEESNY